MGDKKTVALHRCSGLQTVSSRRETYISFPFIVNGSSSNNVLRGDVTDVALLFWDFAESSGTFNPTLNYCHGMNDLTI